MARSISARFVSVLWRVVATATPRVLRHCPGCRARRAFCSSGKFRVNANQRRIDVWLVYRCVQCEATWNRPVHERVAPTDIAPDAYAAYLANDERAAWRCAFDVHGLRGRGVEVDATVPVRVEREALPDAPFRVRFELSDPCETRLDRLVAAELAVSRSQLARLIARGHVRLTAGARTAWRRPVRSEVELVVQAPQVCNNRQA